MQRLAFPIVGLMLSLVGAGCTVGMVAGAPCNGHGSLDSALELQACKCETGYQGADCESCAAGFQDNDGDGECQPNCDTAAPCGKNQRCDDQSGSALCFCLEPYTGPDCLDCSAGYQDNDSNGTCEQDCTSLDTDCGGFGVCSDATGTALCQCDPNYQDNDHDQICRAGCDHPDSVCVHGSCADQSGTAVCSCETEYTGPACDQCAQGYQDNDSNGTCAPTCQTSGYTCSGNGTCDDMSGKAMCNCFDGYIDDGLGNCLNHTFIATAVDDGLNQKDLDLMIEGLEGLGFVKRVENRDVRSSELIDYLQRNVELIYHTGHGSEGLVMTTNGSIRHNSTKVTAQNVIWATCLTLSNTGWIDSFTQSTQTIMGYTKVSYDGTDNQVVKTYARELGNNRSHLQAWYLANVDISSLSDRWAAYAREENGSIREYSARKGVNPSTRSISAHPMIELGDQGVRVAQHLLQDLYHPKQQTMLVEQVENQPFSYFRNKRFALHEPSSLSNQEAIQRAESWLQRQHFRPQDAVIDEVLTIETRTPRQPMPQTVAHVVRFARVFDGLSIRSMGLADHISILVGPDQVESLSVSWPSLKTAPAATVRHSQNPMSISSVLLVNREEIARSLKGQTAIDIIDVEMVYGIQKAGDRPRLVPAYAFSTNLGLDIVIDAYSGQLLY